MLSANTQICNYARSVLLFSGFINTHPRADTKIPSESKAPRRRLNILPPFLVVILETVTHTSKKNTAQLGGVLRL
jgi:hypothetical protein